MATQSLVVDAQSLKRLQLEAAAEELAKNPHLRVLAAHLNLLLEGRFPWWTHTLLLERLPIAERMEIFTKYKHIRGVLTALLTGVPVEAALEWEPSFQADLVTRVMKSGAKTEEAVNGAFEMELLVLDVAKRLWSLFREQMPWGDLDDVQSVLLGKFMNSVITAGILNHHQVMEAIGITVWHNRIGADLLGEIYRALLSPEQKLPEKPLHLYIAEVMLTQVEPTLVAEHIPPSELIGVMDQAEKAMFPEPKPEERRPPPKPSAPAQEATSTTLVNEAPAPQDAVDEVELSPDEVDALNSDAGQGEEGTGGAGDAPADVKKEEEDNKSDGDETQTFRASDLNLPKLGSTLADGGFREAMENSSPSSRRGSDLDRQSSVGFSPVLMERFEPLFLFLKEEGPRPAGLSATPAAETALRGLIIRKEWSKSSVNLRAAEIAFLRYMKLEQESSSAKDPDKMDALELEAAFFHVLIRVDPELVKAIPQNQPPAQRATPTPPVKRAPPAAAAGFAAAANAAATAAKK